MRVGLRPRSDRRNQGVHGPPPSSKSTFGMRQAWELGRPAGRTGAGQNQCPKHVLASFGEKLCCSTGRNPDQASRI